MFWLEWKKQWKRPEVIIALIAICVVQLITCLAMTPNLHFDKKDYREAYEKYSGIMDTAWKTKIQNSLDEYMSNPEYLRNQEEYYTAEVQVLLEASEYLDFKGKVDQTIEMLQRYYLAKDPAYDISRVAKAYANLKAQSDTRVYDDGWQANAGVLYGFFVAQRTLILFIVLFCASIFTSEAFRRTDALLNTSKYGKKKLYWCKFKVNQLAMLVVTLILLALTALIITITVGWSGADCFAQDFLLNLCPYPWSVGTLLLVMALMTIATGQVVAAVVFLLSCLLKSVVVIICASLAVTLLPVLLYVQKPTNTLLELWFSQGLYSYNVWSIFSEIRIGSIYLEEWKLLVVELAVIFVVVFILIWRCKGECAYENIFERNTELRV